MTQYTICIITLPGYIHSHAFQEVAEGLKEGFAELGHVAPIVYDTSLIKGQGIILGANIGPAQVPPGAIIFNLEQFGNAWFTEDYLNVLRTHEVWDYSGQNIEALTAQGVKNLRLCGIGYEPCLTRIVPQEVEDIDVLFYGSVFGQRIPILDAIKATGLKVQELFGVYGMERDDWIARSKIVLNLHAYENAPFEIVRVSYLLANNKCVISEDSFGYPYELTGGVHLESAEHIPAACMMFANNELARRELTRRGFQAFSAVRQSAYLKPLLTGL